LPPHLARFLEEDRYLPGEAGLIVADRYDAAVIRQPRIGRCGGTAQGRIAALCAPAARRLSAQIDPRWGIQLGANAPPRASAFSLR